MGLLNRKGAGTDNARKIEKEIPIVNRLGLHARPAAMFVRIATRFRCEVWVDKEGEEVNGKEHHGLDDAGGRAGFQITRALRR